MICNFVYDAVVASCDSQSIVHLAENLTFNSRMKHIDAREAFLVSMNEKMLACFQKVHIEKNAADMLYVSNRKKRTFFCSLDLVFKLKSNLQSLFFSEEIKIFSPQSEHALSHDSGTTINYV